MGDDACWLHLLCPSCGAVVEQDQWDACPRCGSRRTPAPPASSDGEDDIVGTDADPTPSSRTAE